KTNTTPLRLPCPGISLHSSTNSKCRNRTQPATPQRARFDWPKNKQKLAERDRCCARNTGLRLRVNRTSRSLCHAVVNRELSSQGERVRSSHDRCKIASA